MAGFTLHISMASVAAAAVWCGTGRRHQHFPASLVDSTYAAPSLSRTGWGWAVNQAKPNHAVSGFFWIFSICLQAVTPLSRPPLLERLFCP